MLSFSGSDSYVIMCLFNMCGKNSKNIHLICLISAAATYKGYYSQSDRLVSELVLGEAEVILVEASSS